MANRPIPLSRIIAEYQRLHRLSSSDLARTLRTTSRRLSEYIKGRKIPNDNTLKRFAQVLSITFEDLKLRRDLDKYPHKSNQKNIRKKEVFFDEPELSHNYSQARRIFRFKFGSHYDKTSQNDFSAIQRSLDFYVNRHYSNRITKIFELRIESFPEWINDIIKKMRNNANLVGCIITVPLSLGFTIFSATHINVILEDSAYSCLSNGYDVSLYRSINSKNVLLKHGILFIHGFEWPFDYYEDDNSSASLKDDTRLNELDPVRKKALEDLFGPT